MSFTIPKIYFYDCEAVCSILGASAPYTVPKVQNGKLESDIGFKILKMSSETYHKCQTYTHSSGKKWLLQGTKSLRNYILDLVYWFPMHLALVVRMWYLSGFGLLNCSQVVVVEKLYYRNVIKSCGDSHASKKRIECSCLLQDNVLYTTQESDSHALFMELSCLLFDGTSDLHLANFLHMITTMAESGSTEEQTEFFILNSQKISKLSNEESVWSLPSIPSRTKNDDSLQTSFDSTKSKKKAGNNSNWPPVDWKTAPGFSYARLNGFKTQATAAQPSGSPRKDDSEGTVMETDNVPISIEDDWTIEDDFAAASKALVLSANLENQSGNACSSTYSDQSGHAPNHTVSTMHVEFDPVDLDLVSDGPELGASNFSSRDHLRFGTPNAAQAMQTGRIGESVAFKYIIGKFGGTAVKWVNEDFETGLPYDIIVGEESSREYIEVKATKS
nr:hypothetical protein CFP56_39546 [Quercus suber]